ncbi:transglycosylase SLT domain-containing protein [Rhizobium sp. G187]|uniref:lytic transglycosylase domain-containing protein n=1 Tax=Rhizobium sp. G187 TaxID=3451352 RepID=UPI003EE60BFF
MKRAVLFASIVSCGVLAAGGMDLARALSDMPSLPEDVPVPLSKPLGFAPTKAMPPSFDLPSAETTGTIPRTNRLPAVNPDLKAGLDALSARDGAGAVAIRNRMASGLDRHMLTWSIAMSGLPEIAAEEIAAASRELEGWPGAKTFRSNSERALFKAKPSASLVLSAFGTTAPETTEGQLLLARAHADTGNAAAAKRIIQHLWHDEVLETFWEDRILADFGGMLDKADHRLRMERLLYKDRASQAKRFAALAEADPLYTAWAALIAGSANAGDLIGKLEPAWAKEPAALFIRIENLRKQQKYEEAATLFARMPRERERLVDAGAWWNEQRIIARGLADLGKTREAYQIVANHVATDPADVVDAEFHAGWYALRSLHNPTLARPHFERILAASDRPLSQSRAYYWLGRTAEAAGDKARADTQFAQAARHVSTFYGQLAAARRGASGLTIPYPAPSDTERERFAGREAVRAIARYEAAGHGRRAQGLYKMLAEQLDSPGELALLAARAEKSEGGHHLALQIGKTAYGRGIDVPALAFPVGVIPDAADIAGSGKALAYAIARQESSFNPGAVSPANAQGLLQLMPGTARGVAKRHGIAYAPEKLTRDAGFNATLGAHYLGEQIDAFGGSYILTFIAYNAGPRKVPEWIGRYGDPRGKAIDEVVDWIERIPFPETRNYVQRVMENYQVYKTRLGQKTDIVHDLRFGR